jgi:cobalamin biosynthesis protein CobT
MAEAPFGKSSLRDDDGKEESDKGKTKDEKEEKDDKEDSKGESKKESKEDSKDGSKGESKEESDGSKEHSDKKQSQDDTTEPDVNKNSSADDFEGDVDEIIDKIMEDALENPSPELDVAEDTEKKEKAFKDKMSKWESKSDSTPMDTSDVDSKYKYDIKYVEKRRIYKPDYPLPFEIENKGASLKNKIRDVLKNKRLPDRRGLKSGSIDCNLAHRLIFSDTSIYRKRGDEVKPDMAGYLLLDNSGSMGYGENSNRHYACNAVSVIEEGFKDYMPLKIEAFDALGCNCVTHEVIKDFNEVAPANFTHNFLVQGRTGRGNKDGYSIRVATKELLNRNEKEKLLIVTSDGIPTDYPGGYEEGIKDVRSAVEDARKHGIKVIGLFMYSFQDEEEFANFKRMYEPEYIICEREDMEEELVRVMKRAFLA